MNSDIRFYLALAMRRLPVMMVLFLTGAGIGLGLALTLPPKYVAQARLLVESAQISDDFVRSTVQTSSDKQLQIIEERLMTRANMIDVANKHNVFENQEEMDPNVVFKVMSAMTNFQVRAGNRQRVTIMTISFESGNPRIAADVVNEFVTLVESESAEIRQEEASETAEFFESEVERLSDELTLASAEIVGFKEANKDALPEEQQYRLERVTQLQERLNLAARDRASLNEQRNRLLALGQASVLQVPALTPAQQQLAALNGELSSALSVYSETNPRVVMLKAQIKQLESSMVKTGEGGEDIDPVQSQIDVQVAEIDSRMAFLEDDIQRGEEELAILRIAIEKSPENAIRLEALERDYENIQAQYNEAVAALSKAKVGESIEVQGRGERVSVIERAIAPSSPSSPNRKLVAGGGVFFGSGLAAVFFILTELLNRSIRRPVDLTRGLGVQPLATIPYVERAAVARRRRITSVMLIFAILIAVPLGLWALHTYYLPLDLLAERALGVLGL